MELPFHCERNQISDKKTLQSPANQLRQFVLIQQAEVPCPPPLQSMNYKSCTQIIAPSLGCQGTNIGPQSEIKCIT